MINIPLDHPRTVTRNKGPRHKNMPNNRQVVCVEGLTPSCRCHASRKCVHEDFGRCFCELCFRCFFKSSKSSKSSEGSDGRAMVKFANRAGR